MSKISFNDKIKNIPLSIFFTKNDDELEGDEE